MPGFDSDAVGGGGTLYATNVDFTGTSFTAGSPQVTANGQLLIGSAVLPRIQVGKITSPLGTISIGYAMPNITIDLVGGVQAVEHLTGNTGGTLNPTANNFNIFGAAVAAGTTPVTTAGAVSTITVNVQRSQAIASTDATKIGLAAFNSSFFTVDGNGFVALANASGFPWTDVTGATQTLAVNNGYVTDHVNVTYTLPATASLGDTMKIVGKTGLSTVAQNANQQIDIGSSSSTVGVGGSIAGTNAGDCIELICITAGASTVWRAASLMGNWTVS